MPRLAFRLALAAATLSAACVLPKAPDVFTPFVPQVPPQRALESGHADRQGWRTAPARLQVRSGRLPTRR